MRKSILLVIFLPAMLLVPCRSHAQITEIIGLINSVAKKVVTALDLEVQKLQEQTLELQDAQKQLENAMSLSELNGITSWISQEKALFSEYYQELWQIKNAIDTYQRVKDMIAKQEQLVAQYNQISTAIAQDKHFSAAEVTEMKNVLTGIFNQSVANVNQIALVINAFITQMEDADRLRIMDEAGNRIDKNYSDLQEFSQQSYLLSLQRAKDDGDVSAVKALYGIQ
ncbi:MAG TPA: hypothetical protein VMH27_11595 [Puia sp.]|nr:hypothetical protein [Puia sp.]